MMSPGRDILISFQRKWQRMLWLEIFLLSLGPAVLFYFLSQNLLLVVGVFLLVAIVVLILKEPWKLSLKYISGYIDQKLDTVEYSSGLLLVPKEKLSGMAQLQQHKIAGHLRNQIKDIKPVNDFLRISIITATLIGFGYLTYQFNLTAYLKPSPEPLEQQEVITFTPTDSTSKETEPPVLVKQQLKISYPNYTGLPSISTSNMNVKAVEGSYLSWAINFDAKVDSVSMESMGNEYPMERNNGYYERSSAIGNSGFYNFRFTDTLGQSYVSELYAIEVVEDRDPVVEIRELDQFTSFEVDEDKQFRFTSSINDDFGIAEAYIIATVSKGSGESVKFREERLDFNAKVPAGSKSLHLSKEIDLDELKMEPGDELYFYVEAVDFKQPRPNTSRSETYFAVIRDTTSGGFAVEGTMGVDLMPAYFRSQRQLIIDTEKLISNKSSVAEREFNATSNDLGFDQKVLRLRYGQFMGDESESAIEENEVTVPDHEYNEEDPLAAFSHRHDGDNKHNLVEEASERTNDEEEAENPLHGFLHNHSDPEASTLFTESLKSKLRQALNEMWDAELQLRLYEPEKSLPYQYRALDLIQEIKNSARIYVHRIGFDPPPIKEESRLTGEIEEVRNFQKMEELQQTEEYAAIREAIERLEQIISEESDLSLDDQLLFEKAGNELAAKAIEEPGKYLETLQQLKRLTGIGEEKPEALRKLQRGLILAIPQHKPEPGKELSSGGELNDLFLKELEIHD